MAAKVKKAKARRPTTVRKTVSRSPAVRKAPAKRPSPGAKGRIVSGRASARPLKLAGVSSDAVMRATGRAWEEWLRLLDRAGARTMPHKEIALMLSRKFSVPDWWSQMVTVGYEQARGLRKVHQNARGFSANASKTVGVAVDHLYDAWNDPKKRARWLPDAPVEVKRASGGKSMRMTWTVGDSSIDVGFIRKGEGRSQVAVEHGKLKSTAEVLQQKKFWRDALERLKAIFEPVT